MDSNVFNTVSESFEEDLIKSSTPVALYFHSESCLHCNAFSPLFEKLALQYKEGMKFAIAEMSRNRDIAKKYNVISTPTVLFLRNGEEVCSRLSGYITAEELRDSIKSVSEGQCTKKEIDKVTCDVLVLGGGPAGLSAAIYTARAKLLTMVIDEGIAGGQVATTYHVANYPGTNGVVRGLDLMDNMKKQAGDFGAVIDEMKEVFSVEFKYNMINVKADGTDYHAKSLVIATGATPRKLPAQGENDYRGRGVHYCATCDGAMYQEKDVVVVGGGNSAVEEAVFLTRYAKNVTMVHQFDHFQASKSAAQEAIDHPQINIIWDSEVRKVYGNDFVEGVEIVNIKTKERRQIKTDGVFVYIGLRPRTALFDNLLNMNEQGYIITDADMKTSVNGVYAAGDVREKVIRQIATATGDGVIAGMLAERYVENLIIN